MRTTVLLAMATWLGMTGRADAGIVATCPAPGYVEHPAVEAGAELATRVAASDIPDHAKATLASAWVDVRDQDLRLRGQKDAYDDACREAKARADALVARNSAFEARCGGDEPPDDCHGERDGLIAEYARLEAEAAALDERTDRFQLEARAFVTALGAYHTDAEAALVRWFTGKKVVRMTAKTWIDGGAIEEISLRAAKLRFEGDDVPQAPAPADDFRLYQTFVAEVHFKQGKIKKAFFVRGSTQHRAGKTRVPAGLAISPGGPRILFVGIRGGIYVRDQRVAISADRTRVVFTRKVEGHPSLLVLAMDRALDTVLEPFKLVVADRRTLGSMGTLPTIWSSLRLEVTAEESLPSGDGSEFPSHKFWMGEHLVDERGQVQPSAYFSDD